MTTFDEQVHQYVLLQRALLEAIDAKVNIASRTYFNDLPTGELVLDGDRWEYRGHGRGITFERDGLVVNAHVAPGIHDAVDAWRLELYLGSQGLAEIVYAGRVYKVDEESISELLDGLVHNGKLASHVVDAAKPVKLYRPIYGPDGRG